MDYFEELVKEFTMKYVNEYPLSDWSKMSTLEVIAFHWCRISKKKIVIVGKAASGKDYLARRLREHGLRYQLSVTTRPKRDGEVDGEDYLYVNETVFDRFIRNNMFWEHKKFNGWRYGTLRQEWDCSEVFILTPSAIKSMLPKDRNRCFIIFLDIPENIRKERLNERSDSDKIERRVLSDHMDFEGFNDYDFIVTNPNF